MNAWNSGMYVYVCNDAHMHAHKCKNTIGFNGLGPKHLATGQHFQRKFPAAKHVHNEPDLST